MNKEFAEWVHERCSKLIESGCMKHDQWRWTQLGGYVHETEGRLNFQENEKLLVSFYYSPENWYAMTNLRTVGGVDGEGFEFESERVKNIRTGDFKNNLEPKIEKMEIELRGRERFRMPYEAGFASMAPIHYFKYWTFKHKIWAKTFELNRAQSLSVEQSR